MSNPILRGIFRCKSPAKTPRQMRGCTQGQGCQAAGFHHLPGYQSRSAICLMHACRSDHINTVPDLIQVFRHRKFPGGRALSNTGARFAQPFRRLVHGIQDGLTRHPSLPLSVLSLQALYLKDTERIQPWQLSMASANRRLDPISYRDIRMAYSRTVRRQASQNARRDDPQARFSDR